MVSNNTGAILKQHVCIFYLLSWYLTEHLLFYKNSEKISPEDGMFKHHIIFLTKHGSF